MPILNLEPRGTYILDAYTLPRGTENVYADAYT